MENQRFTWSANANDREWWRLAAATISRLCWSTASSNRDTLYFCGNGAQGQPNKGVTGSIRPMGGVDKAPQRLRRPGITEPV